MIENIIENVKNLSQKDLAKFKEWFDDNYCKLCNQKITPDKESKFVELGDKICELLGVVSFPISGVGKCFDDGNCRVCDDCELMEAFEEYLCDDDNAEAISINVWDQVMDMMLEMCKIGDRSWYFAEKDAYDCSPGNYKYIFYINGGTRKHVNEREFEENCIKIN